MCGGSTARRDVALPPPPPGQAQVEARIARCGIEASNRLGRQRWAIERTVAWLGGFRWLHRRYERKADHLAAFAGIAAAIICT